MTLQGYDSTRSLGVCGGVWNQDVGSRSLMLNAVDWASIDWSSHGCLICLGV